MGTPDTPSSQKPLPAYAEGWQTLASCQDFPQPAVDSCPLQQAMGRVLAQDLHLDRPEPPVSRSAMDGFALRSDDGQAAREVVATYYAGTAGQVQLEPGQAVAIMTGGTVPHGADVVVPVERTTREGDCLLIQGAINPGEHIRQAGEMGRQGSLALAKGTRLGAGDLAVAASVGADPVAVFRQPKVALFSTGDEVVAASSPAAAHQVRDSNLPTCTALLAAAGARVVQSSHLQDDPDALRAAIAPALAAQQLVVTIGGVSMGEKDFLPGVFASLGVTRLFHKLNIQPGKPVWAGRKGGCLVLGLPGNPVSGYVILSLFARLLLDLLGGAPPPYLPWSRPAVTTVPLQSGLRERFLPARLEAPDASSPLPRLTPVRTTGSGDWLGLAAVEVIAVLPPHGRWQPGDSVGYLPALGVAR